MPLCYSCCGIIWPVLVGPFLGLLHAFLSLDYSDPALLLGLHSCYLGFLDPFHCLQASSAHFFLLKHPWLIFFLWTSLTHSNYTFSWAFANSFGLPCSSQLPYPLHLGFMDFPSTHYLLTSLLRTYFGPFLLFYCPWVYHYFLWAPLGPLASFKAHLSFYGLMIHHSCHLVLMVFLLIY